MNEQVGMWSMPWAGIFSIYLRKSDCISTCAMVTGRWAGLEHYQYQFGQGVSYLLVLFTEYSRIDMLWRVVLNFTLNFEFESEKIKGKSENCKPTHWASVKFLCEPPEFRVSYFVNITLQAFFYFARDRYWWFNRFTSYWWLESRWIALHFWNVEILCINRAKNTAHLCSEPK